MQLNGLRKFVLATFIGLPFVFAALIALRAYRAESGQFKNQRRSVPLSPEASAVAGLLPIHFPSRTGETMRGWYVPSSNRSTIVLTHGTEGDRRQVLPEAALLAAGGFGVLLFDFPGHGESDGRVQWAAGDVEALKGALDFVVARPDGSGEKIGIAGFSMGGLIAVRTAVADQRVAALALVGTPSDISELIRREFRRWGVLSQAPALLALERHGTPIDQQPIALVSRLAPRPLLVMSGANDPLVPQQASEALFAQAKESKQFYLIPNAAHGGYLEADPVSYASTLISFFARALVVGPK